MNETKTRHTPGPWTYIKANIWETWVIVGARDGERIAETAATCPCEADARLIAAGPELLDALADILACADRLIHHPNWADTLRGLNVLADELNLSLERAKVVVGKAKGNE
mgnify:CR=1 FL=1